MRFALTDEQLAIRDAICELLARECPPEVVRASWPAPPEGGRPGQGAGNGARADPARRERLWRELAAMGLPGILVDEAAGGLGLDEVAAAVVCEETGYAAVPFGVVETLAVTAPALAAAGPEYAGLLTAVLAGTERPAVAQARVGVVPWVEGTAGHLLLVGDDAICLIETDPQTLAPVAGVDGARRLAMFAQDDGGAAASAVADRPAAGQVARATGVELPGADPSRAGQRAVLCTAAQLVGLTRRMLDLTVAYVAERRQYGVPVGSFQALKHHLADVRVELEFARPAVLGAAWTLAAGGSGAEPGRGAEASVAMAKALASDAAQRAARTALQCHGAIGHTVEYDLHLYVKRAWALAQAWGDAGHHRVAVADTLGL